MARATQLKPVYLRGDKACHDDTPDGLAPLRLPRELLGALFPTPQLLAGRLAASTVAMYTRDCLAYVAFCGYDGPRAQAAPTAPLAHVSRGGYGAESAHDQPHAQRGQARGAGGTVQGLVEREVAEAFRQVEGVSVEALRHRLKAQARVRILLRRCGSSVTRRQRGRCWGSVIGRCCIRWPAPGAASPRW